MDPRLERRLRREQIKQEKEQTEKEERQLIKALYIFAFLISAVLLIYLWKGLVKDLHFLQHKILLPFLKSHWLPKMLLERVLVFFHYFEQILSHKQL